MSRAAPARDEGRRREGEGGQPERGDAQAGKASARSARDRRVRRGRSRELLEVEGDVPRRLEALLGVLFETVGDDPLEGRGQAAVRLGEIGRILLEDRVHRLHGRGAAERAPARQHLVEDGAEGEDVGAMVHGLGPAPARATCSRPCPAPRPRRSRAPRSATGSASPLSACVSFARPKSRIFTWPSFVTNTFSGFRSRWTMPFSWAAASPRAIWAPISTALRTGSAPPADAFAQRLAFEQLRHDVRGALVVTRVVDREDVGMVEQARGARLLLEAAQPVGVGREGGGQDLDRHIARQARVAGAVDLAHSSRAQERGDLVGPDLGSGG